MVATNCIFSSKFHFGLPADFGPDTYLFVKTNTLIFGQPHLMVGLFFAVPPLFLKPVTLVSMH
jgi:hypothetical protein